MAVSNKALLTTVEGELRGALRDHLPAPALGSPEVGDAAFGALAGSWEKTEEQSHPPFSLGFYSFSCFLHPSFYPYAAAISLFISSLL